MPEVCCVCNGSTERYLADFDSSITSDGKPVDKPISHSVCTNCGYIYVNYIHRTDVHDFYNNQYDFLLDFEDNEPSVNNVTYSDVLVNFVAPFLVNNEDKTFIDIGAGKGNFLNALNKQFPNVKKIAIEPSKSYEILQKRSFINKSYNSFYVPSMFPNQTFDYLSAIEVLEHVENPRAFLMGIAKIMSAESLLLIEVPNFKNNPMDILYRDHLSKFTEQSIEVLFTICGYEILKKELLSSVTMRFLLKRKQIVSTDILGNALAYVQRVMSFKFDTADYQIVVYGQGLVLSYLISNNILPLDKIKIAINDNQMLRGKKYMNTIPIINFEDFVTYQRKEPIKIFLAMSECYHDLIMGKLLNIGYTKDDILA